MEKKTKMTLCSNCKAEMPANAKVCPSCGAKNRKPFYRKVTIHSRPKPVKWKTKEIIFCLKANQRLSGRCDLSGC